MEKFVIEKNKIGIVIGKKGITKKLLEDELDVKLTITKQGEVTINGEAVKTFLAFKVIQAICLGFTADDALQLKNPNSIFEIINVKDFAKTKARAKEIKGRLIGKQGKVRKTIEHLGNVLISVSENKVGIIGKTDDVLVVKEAIESLLRGAKQVRIFKWLEHKNEKS